MASLLSDDDKSKIENFVKPSMKQIGILQPLMQHRWRVKFGYGSREHADLLSAQAVSFYFNLVKGEFYLTLEHPAYGFYDGTIAPTADHFMDAIENLCTAFDFKLRVEALDGGTEVCGTVFEGMVHTINHEAGLDYSKSGQVRHVLTLKRGQRPYKPLA